LPRISFEACPRVPGLLFIKKDARIKYIYFLWFFWSPTTKAFRPLFPINCLRNVLIQHVWKVVIVFKAFFSKKLFEILSTSTVYVSPCTILLVKPCKISTKICNYLFFLNYFLKYFSYCTFDWVCEVSRKKKFFS